MMNVFKWIKQKRCKHNYRKHWFRNIGPDGGYAKRCTLCGKEIER